MPSLYEQFCDSYCAPDASPVAIDYSAMGLRPAFLSQIEGRFTKVFEAMDALEKGAIANPDEKRMVGHYWLRKTDLIPKPELRADVEGELKKLRDFVATVHKEGRFTQLLLIGIGGSALGPQLVADALGKDAEDKMKVFFLDNTDPDGIERVLKQVEPKLSSTLVLVISKSGGTPETRNGMKLAEAFFASHGVSDFGKQAVAITGRASQLDKYAEVKGWLARFAMYDWVGGRTSVMSAVGLLPAALQGVDIDNFLSGAAKMDAATRVHSMKSNPAAVLAACWYAATNGRGEKDMVVLPYNDRLLLFSRYLQQLVMESLGKEMDLDGWVVEQGISVYGNKGSTDQHAYVQQLRDGVNNFFVVFLEVLRQRSKSSSIDVEPGVKAGDYLSGFYQGTRTALAEKNRQSLTITVEEVNAETLGALIALFERAVGFYASLVNINAYHQPGVEAGKKAAAVVLEQQQKLEKLIAGSDGSAKSADVWATQAGIDSRAAFRILQYLAANGRGVKQTGRHPKKATFGKA